MDFKKQKILAIIPARGGSKGVVRKNIRLLSDKPLIAHTIESALKSKYLDRIIVSTEDEEIFNVSKKFGVEVIERPNILADDKASTESVVIQLLGVLKKAGYVPDGIILLQPTSPLRTAEDIDSAIEIFLKNKYESVVSVCELKHPVHWSFVIGDKYLKPIFDIKYSKKRRQDLPKAYIPNGAIYISTRNNLLKYKNFCHKNIMPYVMPAERSVDIDNEIDFELSKLLISKTK